MHAHRAERRGPAHHHGRIAQVEGIADIAFSEGHLDVAEPLGCATNLSERGLARPWLEPGTRCACASPGRLRGDR